MSIVWFYAEEISAVSPGLLNKFNVHLLILVDHLPLYMQHTNMGTFTVSSKVIFFFYVFSAKC